MLNRIAYRLHLRLEKGSKVQTGWRLLINFLMILKLKVYKTIKRINHPIVHYYAVCWNEEKMLPFVFDYYKSIVDHFFIYDNDSDDNSEAIIKSHHNASIIKFQSDGFDDSIHQCIKNNCWKKSRGKADFVIVCDIDEFVYHPDLVHALEQYINDHVSLPVVEGYNMFSSSFPNAGENIVSQVKLGIKDESYCKSLLFDPHRVVEINYYPGAHIAKPIGIVKSDGEPLKVLHFKNLGLEYLLNRYRQLSCRLSETNKREQLGTHYMLSEERVISDFNEQLSCCETVI